MSAEIALQRQPKRCSVIAVQCRCGSLAPTEALLKRLFERPCQPGAYAHFCEAQNTCAHEEGRAECLLDRSWEGGRSALQLGCCG